MKNSFRTLALGISTLLIFSLVSCVDDGEQYVRPDPDDESPWVLVDIYHTTKQNPVDYKLKKGQYSYQGVFGLWRAFEHIEQNGYKWTSLRTEPFSKERLEGFDSVFINLVSDNLPDFTQAEVDALIEYVDKGGGLFVIADHTNVYNHAKRVNKFLKPMGIEVLYHTVVDHPPYYSVAGRGWVMGRHFVEHPVTRNLEVVGMLTGGPISSDSGVVFSSSCESIPPEDCSFADHWDADSGTGFYGDWSWNGDESVEPVGPLEFVTAHEYGDGRIVVVGDQNIFGDAWIHFGDNFELFMNATDWVSKKDDDREWLADIRPMGLNIAMPASLSMYAFGKQTTMGLLAFFVNANRDHGVSARAVETLRSVDDVAMIIDPQRDPTDEELDTLQGYLDDGKRVVLMFEAEQLNSEMVQILEHLAPDFSLTSGETTAHANTPTELLAMDYEQVEGVFNMTSTQLTFTEDFECNEDADCIRPNQIASFVRSEQPGFLLDVTSEWGEPFLAAGSSDIARSKRVSNGELIIFFQNRFFRQPTMGRYMRSPADQAPHEVCEESDCLVGLRTAHELQFSLLDYLKTPVEPE